MRPGLLCSKTENQTQGLATLLHGPHWLVAAGVTSRHTRVQRGSLACVPASNTASPHPEPESSPTHQAIRSPLHAPGPHPERSAPEPSRELARVFSVQAHVPLPRQHLFSPPLVQGSGSSQLLPGPSRKTPCWKGPMLEGPHAWLNTVLKY